MSELLSKDRTPQEIEAGLDGIGALVNLYHAITGEQCPRHLAVGMATSAVSSLRFRCRALEAEAVELKQAHALNKNAWRRIGETLGLSEEETTHTSHVIATLQGTRAQLREVEAERDDLRIRLTARENELRTKLYTKPLPATSEVNDANR